MAQSAYHHEGLGAAPISDTALSVNLGQLATHLQVTGQTWVEWNVAAEPYLYDELELNKGGLLQVLPKIYGPGQKGLLVQVRAKQSPTAGVVAVEHGFSADWQPLGGGIVTVVEDATQHTYWAKLQAGRYTVNGEAQVGEADVQRIGWGASFAAAQAEAVVQDIRWQYYTG